MIYIALVLPVIVLTLIIITLLALNITMKKYDKLNLTNLNENKFKESEEVKKESILTFPIKVNDKTILINIETIIAFSAEGNYVILNDVEGNKYHFEFSLKNLIEKLPENFIRIHRSTIINKKMIKEIHKYFNGRYALIMNNKLKSKFISSQSYSTIIKKIIEI